MIGNTIIVGQYEYTVSDSGAILTNTKDLDVSTYKHDAGNLMPYGIFFMYC